VIEKSQEYKQKSIENNSERIRLKRIKKKKRKEEKANRRK